MKFRVKQLNTPNGTFYYPQYCRKFLWTEDWCDIKVTTHNANHPFCIPGLSKLCKYKGTLIHYRADTSCYGSREKAHDVLNVYEYKNGKRLCNSYNWEPFLIKYGIIYATQNTKGYKQGSVAFDTMDKVKQFMKDFLSIIETIDNQNYNIFNTTSEKYSTEIDVEFKFNDEE